MSQKHYLEHEHHEPDAWHRHASTEGAPQVEHGARVNVTTLSVTFVVITLFLVVTVGALIVYFDRHTKELRQASLETTIAAREESLSYRQQSAEQLQSFGWSADGGHVRIPIEVAKGRIIETYATTGRGH